MASDGVDRRTFIRLAASGVVALPGLVAACNSPAPSLSPTAAPAAGAAKSGSFLPAFVPLAAGPKPDYASAGQQYEDGGTCTRHSPARPGPRRHRARVGPGFIATNALKKASPERIKELLRVMDFLASPFGTQEDLLLQYGPPDVHYALDANGKLTLNDRSNVDANYVNWKYLMQHPQVMYVPDIPGYAKAEYEAEHFLVPAGVADPTLGLFSTMLGAKGAVITRTMLDAVAANT